MFTMGLVVALLGAVGALTAWFKPLPQGPLSPSSKEAHIQHWRKVSLWSIRAVFMGVVFMALALLLSALNLG